MREIEFASETGVWERRNYVIRLQSAGWQWMSKDAEYFIGRNFCFISGDALFIVGNGEFISGKVPFIGGIGGFIGRRNFLRKARWEDNML
ncbi:hypothetical protein ACQCVK_17165 [Rossellomorea vietnamensis]|uniref:hypothetical protein n=1 Tax=Rossellomorea vietnamensis TaxID=218284 RepID=UPI003CF98FC7